jgi:CMP-N-acetylneuraminic acid synthetase
MSTRIVAIVPMRHHSERVPGKNYRLFGGRPLYHHIVQTLVACPRVGETVVDTDSETIRADVERTFPMVRVLDRPLDLRGDTVSMNDVLLNDVQRIDADYYLQTHSTNPFLRTESITRAIDELVANQALHDSLFSVTRLQARLWQADATPINHDPALLIRTQDLAPILLENSCLYLFSRDSLERHGSRIGDRPLLFELPRDEAWDIDDETDFQIAEALYRTKAAP